MIYKTKKYRTYFDIHNSFKFYFSHCSDEDGDELDESAELEEGDGELTNPRDTE